MLIVDYMFKASSGVFSFVFLRLSYSPDFQYVLCLMLI